MDFKQLNCNVMKDTFYQCETNPKLMEAIASSVKRQYMIAQEDDISQPPVQSSQTQYLVTERRSFEAAKTYTGKKIAVLNFANNHRIGGRPFTNSAQEESLCRCSTLYRCLLDMYRPFYQKHYDDFYSKKMDDMGNDDLIYTPDVVVFKKDERTNIIDPKMMKEYEWYEVNVITSAAPDLRTIRTPANYEQVITGRIKKILDVAAKEKNEVLILGAWGCGAFHNPTDVVAKVFFRLLPDYNFETVEFALATPVSANSPFVIEAQKVTNR